MIRMQKNGLMSPEDHPVTLEELEALLKAGPGNGQEWDTSWRLKLFTELKKRCQELYSIGIDDIYVDGSFATDKAHPNDIDGYFIVPRKYWLNEGEAALKAIDPEFWRFEVVPDANGHAAYPMAFSHNIELFPMYLEHTLEYAPCPELIDPKIQFFRTDRYTRKPKGIFRIIRTGG